MATLTVLLARVQNEFLNDPNNRFWGSVYLTYQVNDAMDQVCADLPFLLKTYVTANTVKGQALYDTPTALFFPTKIEVKTSATGLYYPLEIIDINKLNLVSNDDSTTEGTPQYAYFQYPGINKFGIYPTAASAVTNGIKLWMIKTPTDLSGAQDPNTINGIPAVMHRAIVYYATSLALKKRKEWNESREMETLYYKTIEPYRNIFRPNKSEIKDEEYYNFI